MGDWGFGIFQDDNALDKAADIREAQNPNSYINEFLSEFLAATVDGYDQSSFADEWQAVRQVMAVGEIIRLGLGAATDGFVPPTISDWITKDEFKPTRENYDLALRSCRRLAESLWLRRASPEIREELDRLVKRLLAVSTDTIV
jgi:hypothetical protein